MRQLAIVLTILLGAPEIADACCIGYEVTLPSGGRVPTAGSIFYTTNMQGAGSGALLVHWQHGEGTARRVELGESIVRRRLRGHGWRHDAPWPSA